MKIEIESAITPTLTAAELSGPILSASFGAEGGVVRRQHGTEHLYFDAPGIEAEVIHVPVLTVGVMVHPTLTCSKGHRQLLEPQEGGSVASRHAIKLIRRIKRASARHERRVVRQDLAQYR